MSVFKDIARFYDLVYADKDYAAEARYADNLLRQFGSAPCRVLELGCGTGRHALELTRLGYDVVATDFSEEMLAAARARFDAAGMTTMPTLHADLRSLDLDRHFDAVIACFHVLNYQTTDADLHAAFATAARHLRPGGLFLFDSWHGPAVLHQKPEVRIKEIRDDQVHVIRTAQPAVDAQNNRVDVHYRYFAQRHGAEFWECHVEVHRVRYLFSDEVRRLAESAGLTMLAEQEWLSGKPTSAATWSAAYVTRL